MPIQAGSTGPAVIETTAPWPAAAAGCVSFPLTGEPLGEASAAELAQVFKALGDPVRLRLISLIGARQGGEVCVCDLTAAFDLTQPTISHHLKVLREAGIIGSERRGTWVYYRLVPQALERMAALLPLVAGQTRQRPGDESDPAEADGHGWGQHPGQRRRGE